jgi:hypothetical protein
VAPRTRATWLLLAGGLSAAAAAWHTTNATAFYFACQAVALLILGLAALHQSALPGDRVMGVVLIVFGIGTIGGGILLGGWHGVPPALLGIVELALGSRALLRSSGPTAATRPHG